MIVEDAALVPWIEANARWLVWVLPAAGVVIVIGVAKWLQRRHAVAH
jgi:hypothetical protein